MKMGRLILLSEERYFKNESSLINRMMEGNDFNLHLRKPGSSADNLSSLLNEIEPRFHRRIVIHQCFELVAMFNLAGIHLPESERIRYPELKSKGYKMVSSSIHHLDHFFPLTDSFEYLFYSPVFPSISKKNYTPELSWSDLSSEIKKINGKQKLIALGGVSKENFEVALNLGFGGVALLGAVWKKNDPFNYFTEFLSAFNGVSR